MPPVPKTKAVPDDEHLAYISRQTCCECAVTPLSNDPEMSKNRGRVSDPHHLRIPRQRRRTIDWLTVPLCRAHHDRFHASPAREHAEWVKHVKVAARLLYRNRRITGERYDALLRCGNDEEKVSGWIDSLLSDLQTWDGGTI